MSRSFFRLFALIAMIAFAVSNARADGPWSFQTDYLLLKTQTSHGSSQSGRFDLDPGQRYALSYIRDSNVGARVTHFTFEQSETFSAPGGTRLVFLNVRNTDFEIFKRFNLSQQTSLEASAGLRRSVNDVFFPTRFEPNDFSGFGGFLAFRGMTKAFTGGDLYARGKYAVLGGDGRHDGNSISTPRRFDQSRTQSEIGFGYQHSIAVKRFIITPSVGAEWMNLSSYLVDPTDEHPEGDMMVSGLTFGMSVNF